MALYEELRQVDVITPVQAELDAGNIMLVEENVFRERDQMEHNTTGPWINIGIAMDRNCYLWNKVYYVLYRIISRNCFHCFKVVARPRNLDELFEVHKLQQRMDLPSKAGIERRPWATHKGFYAAFWYCPIDEGFEGARKHYQLVAKALHEEVSSDIPVILKRACTEMENSAGPSNEWKYPEEQHMLEDILDAMWDVKSSPMVECSALRAVRMRTWIDYARRMGDPTAKKYYDHYGMVGITETVTYHDSIVQIEDMPYRGKRKGMSLGEFQESEAEDTVQGLQANK